MSGFVTIAASQIARFVRRWWRARAHGVSYRGTTRTILPETVRFGDHHVRFNVPAEAQLVADFCNVVFDDEYGLRALQSSPETIVDIGGNVGFFTCFARGLFPDAQIHIYEPCAETAAYTRKNTSHPLTCLFIEGVAREDGSARLIDLGASNIARTEIAADGDIVLRSFAKVLERASGKIDLLKVDCEGAEWDFMRDADLFARVGIIRMEYHLIDGRTLDDLHRMASGIGFGVAHLTPNEGYGIAWLERSASGKASTSRSR